MDTPSKTWKCANFRASDKITLGIFLIRVYLEKTKPDSNFTRVSLRGANGDIVEISLRKLEGRTEGKTTSC